MIDIIDHEFTPAPSVPVVAEGEISFYTNASNWLLYWKDKILGEVSSFVTKLNTIIGQINTETTLINQLLAKLNVTAGVAEISSRCVTTPNISAPAKTVVGTEIAIQVSSVALLLADDAIDRNSISMYYINWGDGNTSTSVDGNATHTYTTGDIGDIYTVSVYAVDTLANPSLSASHALVVSDMYIENFVDSQIVVGEDGSIGQNFPISISSLPTVVGTTNPIDRVTIKIKNASTGGQIGGDIVLLDMEDLNANAPDVETSTAYNIEVFAEVTTDNLTSNTYIKNIATDSEFVSKFDFFEDNSAVALFVFEGDVTDEGGVYNGTPSNITYTTGKFGQGAYFNGTNSIVDIGVVSFASVKTDPFSISFWCVDALDLSGGYKNFLSLSNSDGHTLLGIGVDGMGYFVHAKTDGTSGSLYTGSSELNTWWNRSIPADTHIAIVNTGTSWEFYLDGELSLTAGYHTSSGSGNIGASKIGGTQVNGSNYPLEAPTTLDNFRIFNRALTSVEVTDLYENDY